MELDVESLTLPTPHLTPHQIRVTGAVCEIWIELGRGWGRVLAVRARQTCGGDGLVKVVGSDFVWACCEVQILPPQLPPQP